MVDAGTRLRRLAQLGDMETMKNHRWRDDPPEEREHYPACPATADDGDEPGECTCAETVVAAFDDEMDRRIDAWKDRDL